MGVLIYVARKLSLSTFDTTTYGRSPRPDRMREILKREMVEIEINQAVIGDVFHMAWRRIPQHVALLTDVGILHCHEASGGVIEHPMDAEWRGRVRAAYRFPGV